MKVGSRSECECAFWGQSDIGAALAKHGGAVSIDAPGVEAAVALWRPLRRRTRLRWASPGSVHRALTATGPDGCGRRAGNNNEPYPCHNHDNKVSIVTERGSARPGQGSGGLNHFNGRGNPGGWLRACSEESGGP